MELNDEQLLSDYSNLEKGAYLAVIASLATADREATEEEANFLMSLSETANLNRQQQQEVVNAATETTSSQLKEHLDMLKESELRFSLITDIIGFAKSDGKYSDEERMKISEIANYLNIDKNQYNALNQFVDKAEDAEADEIGKANFLSISGLGEIFSKAGISASGLMKGMIGLIGPAMLMKMFNKRRSAGLGGLANIGAGATSAGLLGNLLGGRFTTSNSVGGIGSIFKLLSNGQGYSGMGNILGNLFGGKRAAF